MNAVNHPTLNAKSSYEHIFSTHTFRGIQFKLRLICCLVEPFTLCKQEKTNRQTKEGRQQFYKSRCSASGPSQDRLENWCKPLRVISQSLQFLSIVHIYSFIGPITDVSHSIAKNIQFIPFSISQNHIHVHVVHMY